MNDIDPNEICGECGCMFSTHLRSQRDDRYYCTANLTYFKPSPQPSHAPVVDIDWSNAPKWANYQATDANGKVWWFGDRPQVNEAKKQWDDPHLTRMLLEAITIPSSTWRTSLTRRPEGNP